MSEPSAKSLFFQEALLEPHKESRDQIEEIKALLESGQYTEGSFLGKGGMKTISLTEDKICKRKLAIARPREDRRDQDHIKLFLNEARITAELEHPNIVPVHEISIDEDEIPYYTMKYIEGSSLEEIIAKLKDGELEIRKLWPLERLLAVYLKVCHAIAFAHSKNIVHLDLKPGNIMVSPYGQVQVCDWGIADYADKAEENLEGRMSGTPGYLSPEQIKSTQLGTHSDIFTLGALLYKILSYEAPFTGSSLEQVLTKTLKGELLPTKIANPKNKVPEVLEAIATKCLSPEVPKRYQSVDELIEDIEKYESNHPTEAANPSAMGCLLLFIKRNKTSSILTLIALSAITIISALFTYKVQEEELKRQFVADKAYLHYTELARENLKNFQFDHAMANIKTSLSYRDSQEANWIIAQLYMIRRDLKSAVKYGQKTELDHERFEIIYEQFKDRKDLSSDQFMLDLISALKKQHYPGMAMSIIYKKNSQREDLNSHLPLLKKILLKVNPAIEDYELSVENNKISFLSGKGFNRLSPFSGLPIKDILVNGSYVRSLEPLSKLKRANKLEFDHTQISSLTPLSGASIDTLSISYTSVNSFSPLVHCQVRKLRFEGVKVIDLAKLKEVEGLEKIVLTEELYNAPHDLRAIKYFKEKGILK